MLIIQNFGRIDAKRRFKKCATLVGMMAKGCAYLIELRSNVRRFFYHFTMYGFIFCFIATVLGAIYLHNLNLEFLRNSRFLFK